MTRVAFLYDGLNLFHALRDAGLVGEHLDVDLVRLSARFLKQGERISSIALFTSIDPRSTEGADRQEDLHRRLRSMGVRIVLGRFARRRKSCRGCGRVFEIFEEKETDINIAAETIEAAVDGSADVLYIVTADSDLVPAIVRAKRRNPVMRFGIIIPPGRMARRLIAETDLHSRIKGKHLRGCRLHERDS